MRGYGSQTDVGVAGGLKYVAYWAKETTIPSGGLMGDLRWSLRALSRHQSGDGSQAADDERKPEGYTNEQYMRGMMGMRSPRGVASCRSHCGALPPCQ